MGTMQDLGGDGGKGGEIYTPGSIFTAPVKPLPAELRRVAWGGDRCAPGATTAEATRPDGGQFGAAGLRGSDRIPGGGVLLLQIQPAEMCPE
ncbi:MAG: hypothetical protein IJK63_11380 [Oscillospiraceae bacterium]|nr:hypothetical protein [Oscillospiraceae bacterium]